MRLTSRFRRCLGAQIDYTEHTSGAIKCRLIANLLLRAKGAQILAATRVRPE